MGLGEIYGITNCSCRLCELLSMVLHTLWVMLSTSSNSWNVEHTALFFHSISDQRSAADYHIYTKPSSKRSKIANGHCAYMSVRRIMHAAVGFFLIIIQSPNKKGGRFFCAGVTTRSENSAVSRLLLPKEKKKEKRKELLWSMNRWRRRIFSSLLLTISSIFISYADDSQFFFRLSSFSLVGFFTPTNPVRLSLDK